MTRKQLLSLLLCLPLLGACSNHMLFDNRMVAEAQVTDRTRAGEILASLPLPAEKIQVALYDFQDQTGQFKYNGLYTDYSSAVTKGGLSILTKALLDAGNRGWFTVMERGGLQDLLKERQITSVMRAQYQGPHGEKLPDLPPMLYSGMLIEGGIISYDSNVVTGGLGATYLGISASTQYHRDVVTVYLRAINVRNGEVLASVTSSKTIYSTSLDSNLLKYITFDRLLQAEAGFSVNEPTQLGVRQAIETAVYSLIMEGAIDKLWEFKDPAAGQQAIAEYLHRRDGTPMPAPEKKRPAPAPVVAAPAANMGTMKPLTTPPAPIAAPAPAPVAAPAPAAAAPVVSNPPPVASVPAPAPSPAPAPANANNNSPSTSDRYFSDSPYEQLRRHPVMNPGYENPDAQDGQQLTH